MKKILSILPSKKKPKQQTTKNLQWQMKRVASISETVSNHFHLDLPNHICELIAEYSVFLVVSGLDWKCLNSNSGTFKF